MAKKAVAKKKVGPAGRATDADERSATSAPTSGDRGVLDDIPLTMTIELGRTRQTIGGVQSLGEQSLVELDKTVGDPVDILLNGELWARGEVVTVNENFGVRVTEVVSRAGG
jgi:flagellar motor switch protein FliN/FliY